MSKVFDVCKIQVDIPVAWGEMDAYQHVNNVMYFRYFETARIAYFERVGVNAYKEHHGVGPILASTQCRFKAPLTYPDTLSVATRVTDIGADRFNMSYLVKSHNSGRIAAEGEGLIVYYDYGKNCKHIIPESISALDSPASMDDH